MGEGEEGAWKEGACIGGELCKAPLQRRPELLVLVVKPVPMHDIWHYDVKSINLIKCII